jgi:hypothetical protein
MRYGFYSLSLLTLFAVAAVVSLPPQAEIITWGGNTPEWNRALHLTAVRVGCSGSVPSCMNEVNEMVSRQGVGKVFLAIFLHSQRTPSEAAQYSQLSLIHPALYEVGFDDFVSQCEKLSMSLPNLSSLLVQTARNLKSANPNLRLGVTIYEDQLASPRFPLEQLDAQFRQQVDFVHLFPHYRQEERPFSSSVQLAKQLFPSARIIAGVYAYDRRDYFPCARGSAAQCSNQQELALFDQTFREQMALLANGTVSGIEFYPGDFGMIEHWKGWNNPRICRERRKAECIANTKAMRDYVRQFLTKSFQQSQKDKTWPPSEAVDWRLQ